MATKKPAKPKAAPKPKKPPKPRAWAEHGSPALSRGQAAPHLLTSTPALAMMELLGAPGLADVVIDLVGERQIRLSSALSVWQAEQDRIANRTWRRPGGLVRLGGL